MALVGARAGRADPSRAACAERGLGALRAPACSLGLSLALAGLLLALLPGMDHLWLDWLEEAAPAVRLAFLTPGERAARRDSARGARARHRRAGPTARAPAGRAVGRAPDARRAAGAPAPVPRLARGDRRGRPDGAGHAARPRARAPALLARARRCSCWARRAPRGSASSRGHGAAGRIRTARRADTTATALGAPAPPRASARPHRSLALGSGPCQIGRCPRPSDAANRDRLQSAQRLPCRLQHGNLAQPLRNAEGRDAS